MHSIIIIEDKILDINIAYVIEILMNNVLYKIKKYNSQLGKGQVSVVNVLKMRRLQSFPCLHCLSLKENIGLLVKETK